jgi:hypothetical protein
MIAPDLAARRQRLPNWQWTLPANCAWQCVIAWQCEFFPEIREKPSDCSCGNVRAFSSMEAGEGFPTVVAANFPHGHI